MSDATRARRRRQPVARALVLLALLLGGAACEAAAGTILVVGDSLSAGYGIAAGKGWVDLLSRRLAARATPWRVVNASISGDTTSAGLERLGPALEMHRPDVVILELGANDALRGQPIDLIRDNLGRMIARARADGAQVVLLGMRMPPNYGPAYTRAFQHVYRELGALEGVTLVDFLLDGVALDLSLMQDDGIHPTEAAQPVLLDTVWAVLEPLLEGLDPGARG